MRLEDQARGFVPGLIQGTCGITRYSNDSSRENGSISTRGWCTAGGGTFRRSTVSIRTKLTASSFAEACRRAVALVRATGRAASTSSAVYRPHSRKPHVNRLRCGNYANAQTPMHKTPRKMRFIMIQGQQGWTVRSRDR